MNLRQIEVFRAVMMTGSVSDGARMLHVSQPGISRMLAHIELQLGLTLFERRKNKLLPTPEAHALHAEVAEVYGGIRRISEVAAQLKHGARLALRIVASPSTALAVVPRAVATLAQEFPSASLHLETLPVREMVTRLVAREADVAISTLPIDHAMLKSKPIGHWRLACVFPKAHAFSASRRALHPREVVRERLIAFSRDTPQGRIIADWCASHDASVSSSFEVRSGQVACAIAAAGGGVAVVDEFTARACNKGELGYRLIAGGPSFEVFAVTAAGIAESRVGGRLVALTAKGLKAPSL